MVTSNSSNSQCLVASKFSNRCASNPVFYLDISWGQWRINHGAPAPGPFKVRGPKSCCDVLLIKTKSFDAKSRFFNSND